MVYPMVLLLPLQTSKLHPLLCIPIPIHTRLPRFKTQPRRTQFPISSVSQNPYQSTSQNRRDPQKQRQQQQQPPRTLYPGGYKRPEIKVPSFVLQLEPNDILADGDGTLELIDKAVSKWVRIVVLNGAEASGGKVYEAACKLKSVVRDRAYLLVSERVDIAAAANASGVVLSDQGLPAIVARNTMMDSKSDSVFLPLVGRNVQTLDAALNASNSEGADFLIYGIGEENQVDVVPNSVFRNVKIPIFAMFTSGGEDLLLKEASILLKSGASGLVSTLKGFEMFSDDALSELFDNVYTPNLRTQDELDNLNNLEFLDEDNNVREGRAVAGFIKLEDREKQFIDREKSILLEAIKVIQRAAPLMEEVSLLTDAVSRIDEPFLLAIVGEFNSGKSTVINALLGRRYLKDGVVPTTNEITFLRYSKLSSGEEQRCERHPDGQYICYLPAPILKDMNIVDTPGTNVILQRQQRLTEEFVPRADLLLFVISADRPLTESEVSFLRYTQQWKKKVVFILNKSDLYQNTSELEEAILFIKENTQKMLNTEHVILYPVSARSALEAKLSSSPDYGNDSHWKIRSFYEFESFLYSFLDGSTSTGMERMKLKLGTPVGIAERLLSSCETLVRQDLRYAKQDLASINDIVESVKDYALKMESESISWRRKALSLIDTAKSRVMDLIEATLQLSNLDIVTSYAFKGQKSATMPATSRVQNDIIGPGLLDAQKLLGEYATWLESSNTREGMLYKESFERRWPLFVNQNRQLHMETLKSLKKANELSLGKANELSLGVIRDFKGTAASKLFDQEIREVFLGTFGGLGAAGFSASLLTSVLPTTLEDLLALGLCSAGGLLAISNFPARRQAMIDKVKRTADALARELEEAMRKDLLEAVENMENFVKIVAEPYQDAAQHKLENLLRIQDEISNIEKELQTLQFEIQNLHVS